MTTSLRTSSLVAGASLALMAVLAPLGLLIGLPAGTTGLAALVVLIIAALDVVVGIALYPLLAPGGQLLAQISVGLRVAYAAVFATAAGSLLAPADVAQFQAIWDAGLLLFGAHLLTAGAAIMRTRSIPIWIGALVLVSGLGYTADTALLAFLAGYAPVVATFTFLGEIVLLVWLLGWGGRGGHAAAAARAIAGSPALQADQHIDR